MDWPVTDKTPDFVKALDIDHARDSEVMLAYTGHRDRFETILLISDRLRSQATLLASWKVSLLDLTITKNGRARRAPRRHCAG
jgi:hypothetical protein